MWPRISSAPLESPTLGSQNCFGAESVLSLLGGVLCSTREPPGSAVGAAAFPRALLSSHDVHHSPVWHFQSLRAAEAWNESEHCNFSPSLIWGEGDRGWGGEWVRWNVLSNLPTAAQFSVSCSSELLTQAPSSRHPPAHCQSLHQARAASFLGEARGTGRPGHRARALPPLSSCPLLLRTLWFVRQKSGVGSEDDL